MMRSGQVEQPVWLVQSSNARLTCGALRGQIDVARPQTGLHEFRVRDTRLDGHLLAVSRASDNEWPLHLAEAYVRGEDLVAAYEAAADWPYAPQIYWRAEGAAPDENTLGSLSLLVSVQTHLLDTCPRIDVTTHLAADEALLAGAGCVVWRLPGGTVSYAEMMPAGDFRELALKHEADGTFRTNWELFAEFLEKGVIRKARLQAVVLPRKNDVALARAYYESLAQQPLPLTT